MNKVCVIGVGPSGITALKNLLDLGIDAVAYDKNADVGGNWIYNKEESHSSVFETTHIISSKTLSQYEDFIFDEFEEGIPDYPSHDQLRRYFQAYATRFDLYPHIHFNSVVEKCVLDKNNNWVVNISVNGTPQTEIFTHLVVCNGHHWCPRMPNYPGVFEGEFIHSHQYKNSDPFKDKKVLVIGGGNSACDVAVETSRSSKKTTISWRRGYKIVPKFMFGKPSDVVGYELRYLPLRIRYFLSGLTVRLLIGSNEKYNLLPVRQRFGSTHPIVNDELLYKIRHGKVHPKGEIERYSGKTVYFKDGSEEKFDIIVACTGYIISHPFFDKQFIDYSEGEVPLYLKMFHEKYENLYFIGLFQPLGCIWPGAELQSRLMAGHIKGIWQRPSNIKQLCQREVTHPHLQQVKSARHTITVDYHKFVRQLKKQLTKSKRS